MSLTKRIAVIVASVAALAAPVAITAASAAPATPVASSDTYYHNTPLTYYHG